MAPQTGGSFTDHGAKPETSLINMLRHHRRFPRPFDETMQQPLGVNEQAWLDLLQQRPNIEDTTQMADWMGRILHLSGESQNSSSEIVYEPLLMPTLELNSVQQYPLPNISIGESTLTNLGFSAARASALGQSAARHYDINTPRVSPCLTPRPSPKFSLADELELENHGVGSQESGSSSSTTPIIAIEPLPLTTPTLQIDLRLVSPCPTSSSSNNFSMEELDLDGCYGGSISRQSSTGSRDSILMQRDYSSDKVASEIAEFTTYMDAIDMSTVFD
jgi:hypothetical protein